MGFLRYLKFILFALIGISCAKPLILKEIRLNADKYYIFGGSNHRDFFSEVTLEDSLEYVWSNNLNGSQWTSSVTIMDNLLIASDLAGRVFAFDRKSGKEKGAVKYKGAIFHQPLIYKNKLHFVVNEEKETYSTLYYYDFINSKNLLEINLEGNVRNELLMVDNNLFVLTDNGDLHKYNPVGTEIVNFSTGVISNTSPICVSDKIVFANIDGEIIVFNNATEKIEFRKKITSSFKSNISGNDQNVYAGTDTGEILCFNLKANEVLWSKNTGVKIIAAPSLDDKLLFVGDLSGMFYALNKVTGDIIWKYDTKGLVNNSALVTNKSVLIPDHNKKLHVLDKITGKKLSINEFDGRVKSSPVYFDSLVYIGYDKGMITALRGIK